MSFNSPSERMGGALTGALRHAEYRGKGEAAPGPPPAPAWTIAVSRQAGAGGLTVASEVGQRLGWPVYDRALLEKIAQGMGRHPKLLEGIDERRASWLQECLEAFTSQPGVSHGAYLRHLGEVLFSLGAQGACIIVGRGAAQVLPPASTLRVRLVGPLPARVAAVAQQRRISAEEASSWVEQTDRERARFVRDHFGKDPDDPAGYDLVLNPARLGVVGCADAILAALDALKRQASAGLEAAPRPR
jgi:cytidylate kinase